MRVDHRRAMIDGMNSFATDLKGYGAETDRVLSLVTELGPELLHYTDLMASPADCPDAVFVDDAGNPIAYIVDGRRNDLDDEAIARLRRLLAFRGDGAFLAIALPGRLDIYETGLTRPAPTDRPLDTVGQGDSAAGLAFPRLQFAPQEGRPQERNIHEVLLQLMNAAIDALHPPGSTPSPQHLSFDDAVSLVGRAVFIRFLRDRRLLDDASAIIPGMTDPRALFDSDEDIAATFDWQDRTFNGDLLPVSFAMSPAALAARLPPNGRAALGHILWAAPGGQLTFAASSSQPMSWADLDFSRIPVGVLSQVYESQAKRRDAVKRNKNSIYYTPSPVAGFMVSEVFNSLGPPDPDEAPLTVLDPAVGGGIFLVMAFRELVARRWARTGIRPDTAALRSIVYDQLGGFDIDATALRLTALSLYLAAIELDPEPLPLERLRFERPLLGTTLFDVGGEGPAGKAGSLGSNIGPDHDHQYDIVVGNPPWTTNRLSKPVLAETLQILRPIVKDALGDAAATEFAIPDGNPDLCFLWRATRWAKPGGHIALITHARFLFKQSDKGIRARGEVLRACDWTSIVNGSALRDTKLWPNNRAQFALVFGVNDVPPAGGGGFYFYSPRLEKTLNDRGHIRIDAEAAVPVWVRDIIAQPTFLKTLFRGTALDIGVARKVRASGPAIGVYWKELGLNSGQGYQIAASSGRGDARFLMGLPDIRPQTIGTDIEIDAGRFEPFERANLHRPRKREIYCSPIVLARKAMISNRDAPTAHLVRKDAVYFESFFGFSSCGHADAERLAQYVVLLLNSEAYRWLALMTSGQYGVEREVIQFADMKAYPIPRLEDLAPALREQIPDIWAAYIASDGPCDVHKDWVCGVYGLTSWDWQVIVDTLAVSQPSAASRTNAQRPPLSPELNAFGDVVATVLESALGLKVPVRVATLPGDAPWRVVSLWHPESDTPAIPTAQTLSDIRRLSNAMAASHAYFRTADATHILIPAQYRYWTRSRARLLALNLFQDDAFLASIGQS